MDLKNQKITSHPLPIIPEQDHFTMTIYLHFLANFQAKWLYPKLLLTIKAASYTIRLKTGEKS